MVTDFLNKKFIKYLIYFKNSSIEGFSNSQYETRISDFLDFFCKLLLFLIFFHVLNSVERVGNVSIKF